MTEPPLAKLQETLAQLEALDYQKTYRQFFQFRPYPKQKEFLDLGTSKRERLLIAGNQNGKTHTGAYEAACHLTGDYPKWWTGGAGTGRPRAGSPARPRWWYATCSRRSYAASPASKRLFGTGMIPKDKFADKPSLARGITDAYDTIQVRHKSGGVSVGRFKSYEQGRTKFQGESIDWGWADEEPPEDVYAELLTRTVATKGMVFMTFTPLKGRLEW
jgi:phage terminase large subunit-like protein